MLGMTETHPGTLDGDVSAELQVLATEHWSLLATRALTFNESLSRVSIFLAILSGALIALALVAQADHFGTIFIGIAIPTLGLVLFAGIATVGRLMMLNRDDFRWVVGMNRLRNAYLARHPELTPHFITSPYDDVPGVLQTLGIDPAAAGAGHSSVLHLFQTLPGMLAMIVAAVGGAIGALGAVAAGAPSAGVIAAGAAAFLLVLGSMIAWSRRSYSRASPSLEPRFPSPPSRP